MPYKSDAQRRFMHAEHPDIAARWDKEYGTSPVGRGGSKMPNKRAFKRALASLDKPGRRVGRNMTPGTPRRVGSLDPEKAVKRQQSIAPGEPDPNSGPPILPNPDGNPSGNPDPRPMGTLGMRRLNTLSDDNKKNDKRGLEVAMRLFGRAQAGKGFGYKAFGERVGGGKQSEDSTADFFTALKPYLQGTGYNRMFRQAAGLPVKPKVKNYPGKPRGNPDAPGPYIPRDPLNDYQGHNLPGRPRPRPRRSSY